MMDYYYCSDYLRMREAMEPLAHNAVQQQIQHEQPADGGLAPDSPAETQPAGVGLASDSPAETQQPQHRQPATPAAWEQSIVKTEPTEHMEQPIHLDNQDDKNNDSGVSPGHYTSDSASPLSRRSSTDVALSSPADSHSSHDSGHQPISGDELSQMPTKTAVLDQPMIKSEPIDDHEKSTQETVGAPTASTSANNLDYSSISSDLLKCPSCKFSTTIRLVFAKHLLTHCPSAQDDPDLFLRMVMMQLTSGSSSPNRDSNSQSPSKPNEPAATKQRRDQYDFGMKAPRITTQGKIKTNRCKQCDFIALTKLDFWNHSRLHIKPDKVLTCPNCPFVTEYKHHLEYHLRNHVGSKPYKCELCDYTCVNKSMLNSHLKSHSSIYQFRCEDCSYATKYCHSLKMHLRKYRHKPAMVLNSDGTPNPLPIIDVYGTKRGPKAKPKKENALATSQPQIPQPSQSPVSPSGMPMVPQPSTSTAAPMCALPGFQFNQMSLNMAKFSGFVNPQVNALNMFPLFRGFPFGNPFGALGHGTVNHQMPVDGTAANYLAYAKNLASTLKGPNEFPQRSFNEETQQQQPQPSTSRMEPVPGNSPPMLMTAVSGNDREVESETVEALDLTKRISPSHDDSQSSGDQPQDLSVRKTAKPKGRRKGLAIKLDRHQVQEDSDEEMKLEPEAQSVLVAMPSPSALEPECMVVEVTPPLISPSSSTDSKISAKSKVSKSNAFCTYCNITFSDEAMYSIHMGYHGFKDPFTCNMCGVVSKDALSFFNHTMRVQH